MSNDLNTDKSYLSKRTTKFLSIKGSYTVFMNTCDRISEDIVYSKLRNYLLKDESKFKEELKMAEISFLKFVGNEYTKESNTY